MSIPHAAEHCEGWWRGAYDSISFQSPLGLFVLMVGCVIIRGRLSFEQGRRASN